MDTQKMENQLVLQCAPVMMGVKVSNLLQIDHKDLRTFCTMFKDTELSFFALHTGVSKSTILLYQRGKLMDCLEDPEIKDFLAKRGYEDLSLYHVLHELRIRYGNYFRDKQEGKESLEFPHEMGLILGYPLEDVVGFMENKGKNALLTGYWKVYHRAQEKEALFQRFEQAKETLIRLMSVGVELPEILNTYCNAMSA